MATTLIRLKELSKRTVDAIVKSPDAWKKYLNAAPRIFRYSFEDQLLIYAQAPKATAVATYDVWNRIMHRAVKKGSSGIGLIHAKRRYEKIDYVFDVSQTVERYDSRPLNIWKITDENESQIREYLQNMLSVDESSANIPDLMQLLVKESVEDVIDDLYDALKEDVDGTYLDGLEEDQLKYEFRELLNHSIYYVCLGKCGYDPDMYLTTDAFDFITNFNDLSVLRHLGYATTETCNSILHGITICLERNRKRISQEQIVQDTASEVVPVDSTGTDVPNFGTSKREDTVFVAWIMFIAYYLDQNRNYHFGVENGSEQWADVKKLSKTLRDSKNEQNNTYLSEHIAVSNHALSNMNMLVIGGSGSYKTTSVLTPNILLAGMTNVILDIKGDLLRKHGNYLKAHGITVKSFNLINPEESDRYNPMYYLEKETDVIRLITNMQASVKPPDAMKGDPFWDDGVALYLQAMFFHEWLTAKEEKRKPTLNNILKLVNMESKKVGSEEDEKTELQIEMDRLAGIHGDDYPPVRDYRKLKEGASETVRSIIIMVNAMLRLCETAALKRLFEDDDIDIPSLGLGADGNPNKKTALFLVMPDNDQSFNFLISMFYTQLFDVLIRIADHKCNGSLPIHVRLWADEFYAGPKPTNTEVLMGTIRSRNMSIVPILQSVAQIKAIFPQEKWEVFLDNCAVMMYLGSGPAAYSTHEYISKLLGEMTIDTRNDGVTTGMHGNSSLNNQRTGRGLMSPGEVKRMKRKYCIIFIEEQYPIMDRKNLPFNTPAWKESEKLAGKKGYKHPVRVVYNPKTMTYRTIKSEPEFQVIDKKDIAFYKEAEKTDKSIKVCEIDEKDFLYLNFDAEPRPTEEELLQMFANSKKDMKKSQNMEKRLEESPREEEKSNVPNFGTLEKLENPEKWDLSGSVNQCILRYAARLNEDQINEILLGLENGLTEKQVKTYFILPADKMKQYRRAYEFANE